MIDMSDAIMEKALDSLGKGFDVTSDFRLKFCKGKDRIVLLNETDTRELQVPGFGTYKNMVSVDIKCDKGDRTRYQSDILQFNKMSEFFNQKSSLPGKIPSGKFNSMFGFNSSTWARDATNTNYLGLDGYFFILYNLLLRPYPLLLSDKVRDAVPPFWDPSALARFIKKYGTHIIVGLSIGGHDVILLKQDTSSNLGPAELKKHLDDLGDQLFTGTCSFTPQNNHNKRAQKKNKAPEAFNLYDTQPFPANSFPSMKTQDGITVICSKRGGDPALVNNHHEWLLSVPSKPDAVQFSFVPITSLLKDVPGRGFLSYAINLYLRYKPPIADLEYFLDFQGHRLWAPIHNDLPLGPERNKALATPALHFNFMGPKLYVNTTKVTVGMKPVTGMRLYLEGKKGNRLAIHLQHLSYTPITLQNKIDHIMLLWRGSDEMNDKKYFEPVQSKQFSHISTAPVKYDPKWNLSNKDNVAFIVTGAQLHITKHNGKNILHLRLLFSKVVQCGVVQSAWAQGSSETSQKSGFFSSIGQSTTKGNHNHNDEKDKQQVVVIDSAIFPSGPPVPVQTQKLLKFVDMSHLCKGPQDSPGHWLVTGAKLDLEKGKICFHVKFSLLNMCSSNT